MPPTVTFKEVVVSCDTCGDVPLSNISWYPEYYQCDTCGSHGKVEVTGTCTCGTYVSLNVYSW